MTELSNNSNLIFKNRYAINEDETWQQMSERVGNGGAQIEQDFRNWGDLFSEDIYDMRFLPGGRILRNIGRPRGSLFNCYVEPLEDSMEQIGDFQKNCGVLWSEGGGVGCNASFLRPEDAPIVQKGGESSGPISFLKWANAGANCIKTGGARRAAALAMMNVRHPDILKFINTKLVEGELNCFNISVGVTEDFLQAVEANDDWELKWRNKIWDVVKARDVWNLILDNMVSCAEPGLINWDNLRSNNSYYFDPIVSTNPSLRKGTKILTDSGIIPIEKLQDKKFNVPNIRDSYSNATCFLSGKNKRLYRIELQGGYEYFATAEHKWPIVNRDKWNYSLNDFNKKRTDKLQEGDYLPQPNKKKSLNYGSIGDYEDGFLIGWNIGDGWISNNDRPNQIGFIVSEEDQKYGIHNILIKRLRKLGWKGEFKNRRNNKETNIQNKKLRNLFEYFGTTKKEFGIPKSIWKNASEEFRKGFIDALFSSDGSIDSRIILTSSHSKLIYDVAELLGFYGIQSSVKYTQQKGGTFPNGKYYDKVYDRYTLTISRQSSILHFHKIFNLSHKRKQEILDELVKGYDFISPMNGVKIISIEKTDLYEDVWDITVYDDEHCFELSQVITGNCGEVPLGAHGVCCLGSLVLPNFITGTKNTNWQLMEKTVYNAVRFLDNIIQINRYVIEPVKRKAFDGRRIGVGVMGLAEYLFAKGVRYGSKEATRVINTLMENIRNYAYEASCRLSQEKEPFPKFDVKEYSKAHFFKTLPASLRMDIKKYGMRNVSVMAVAPTGTISLLPEVSSSVEPLFCKAYLRKDQVGERAYIHPIYKKIIENNEDIPDWYVDSYDLKPEDHFETQVAVQKYLDGAVSKTINCPRGFQPEQLSDLLLEYIRDLKGVTLYVDGSREGQILNQMNREEIDIYLKEGKTVSDQEEQVCSTGSCEI